MSPRYRRTVPKRDLLSRLADAGEEALGRLAEGPGAERVVAPVRALRDRVDELQRRVLGVDELERRVADLEGRLAGPGSGTASRRRVAPPSTKVSGPRR